MEKRIPKRRFKEFIGTGEWEEKKLGELVEYGKAGGTPTTTNNKYYDGGNIEFLSISDMTNQGKYIYKTEKKITKSGVENSTTWIVPKNSLIYSMYASIGFVSINKIELCTSQAMYSIILKDRYNLDYVYYYLYYFRNEKIKSLIETGTQGNLNAQLVKDINIPIPSLAEQEKIGHFFQKLDRLIDINKQKLGKLKASKSAYLEEMFPGEGEDRPKRRFKGFTGKWEEKKFEDIFEVSQGLQIAISKRFTNSGENRFFYITNEILKDSSKSKYYVYNPPKNVLCKKNDILMTRTGNTGIIVTDVEGCFHNNFFKIKYDYSYLNKDFICELLSSPNMQKKILSSAGNSTIPDLSHRSFYNLSSKFPSLAEQEKIGNFFKRLDQQIGVQEEKLEKLEKIKKAYLAEMFV